MTDMLDQAWQEIVRRPDGPAALRFYLQVMIATLFAVHHGLKDARTGRGACLWVRLSEGWKSMGIIFILAGLVDVIYQLIMSRPVRPFETAVVIMAFAILPYALFRGPVNRIAKTVRRQLAAYGVYV
jgi:hypothetical protein